MLKALLFAATITVVPLVAAAAEAPVTIVVGDVRERDGGAIVDGLVRALAADGATLGTVATDRFGTFALALPTGANVAMLEVRCRYCRTVRVRVAGDGGAVVVFLERDATLASDIPSADDLRALPYGRIADVLGLAPYRLPTSGGGISDRGLARGRTLVVDDGVAIENAATVEESDLASVPDRYTQTITTIDPIQAFRYGAHGAGGAVVVESAGDETRLRADLGGGARDRVIAPRLGDVAISYGASEDLGTRARRGDFDLLAPAFGGNVRVGVGLAQSVSAPYANTLSGTDRSAALARIAYGTTSRRYTTSVEASFANVGTDRSYRSQYASGSLRIERPGTIVLGITASGTLEAAHFRNATAAPAYDLDGRIADETLALDARTSSERGAIAVGIGATNLSEHGTLTQGSLRGDGHALVPSFEGTLELGRGVALHVGYAGALDAPTLDDADLASMPGKVTFELGRSALSQAAVRFDDGRRIRAEFGAYRGLESGFAPSSTVAGFASSLAWQVVPHLDVRAWNLAGAASRALVWTTYANPSGLRLDVIARSERTGPFGRPLAHRTVLVDADALVALDPIFALDFGTVARAAARTFTLGLRVR